MQAQHITILVGLTICVLLLAVLIKRGSDRETLLLTIEFKNLAISAYGLCESSWELIDTMEAA